MDKRWQGKTVACIASGPSLTAEDCALIEQAGIRRYVFGDLRRGGSGWLAIGFIRNPE